MIFFVGSSRDRTWQKDIDKENSIYQDIIQEDFIEEEVDEATKIVMIYKWTSLFCPTARFIMLTKDDTMVDVFKLVPYLQQEENYNSKEFILCNYVPCCEKSQTGKSQSHAPVTTMDLYEGEKYPAYCKGSIYVAPYQVIHDLFLMSMDTPVFQPADAWTGVLAVKLDLKYVDTSQSFVTAKNEYDLMTKFRSFEYLHRPILVGVACPTSDSSETADLIRRIWNVIHIKHKGSRKLNVASYMADIQRTRQQHIYPVATVAIAADLLAISFVGYIVMKLKIFRFKWRFK